MVLTFDETKELEVLKHNNRKELADLMEQNADADHNRKMERLNKLLEIAKAAKTPLPQEL